MQKAELLRYIINGLAATLVHYSVLNFNLLVIEFESAGVANMVAACFGIAVSFIGSRYYVYRGHTNSLSSQFVRFSLLYAFIALLHGVILFIWTDVYALNHHVGFLLATFFRYCLVIWGIRYWFLKMKIKKFLVGLVIFGILLSVIYLVHVKFFKIDVIFYSAILDGLIAAFLSLVILWKIKYFGLFSSFEKIQALIIYLLLGYSFAISVPTVIDRSLSFYILEKIDQRGGGIKLAGFEDVFTKEYMLEHRLVDVRITEQLSSGTVIIENGCVKITDKGRLLTSFSRFFRKNLLPKQRLLMGKYSSDLTDPFANGAVDDSAHFDYICK